MKILLYNKKIDKILETLPDKTLDELYNNLSMIPTIKQLNAYDSNIKDSEEYINLLRIYISRLNYKLPLFDYATKNIYLIIYDDIYNKITIDNYRFPNTSIIELLKSTIKQMIKLESESESDWIKPYIKKLEKNLNFLSNFDLNILKETFIDVFLNTNPTSKEITSCIKPSYLAYQDYQSPYYSKSELVSMALNLKLIPDNNIKPYSFSGEQLKNICQQLSDYEIDTKTLLENQLYILYNNAKSYVQFYSLFGSYYFNNYMRNKESIKDPDLEQHISNMLKIIEKAPKLDTDYEVYRFIENDDYLQNLKIGSTFNEDSFISTTRNPFYPLDNVFGFILIKIVLKKNQPGIALLIESYSNYPSEQEILLPPSKLKLISISDDFKYYHWNKLAERKIIKKYVFEYVETIGYDIKHLTSNYSKFEDFIPEIDFFKQSYGTNTSESMFNFFNSLTKINLRRFFYSKIGLIKYKFSAYFLTQNKVYSKFFFLQKSDEENRFLGDEIYLTIQNPINGEIELIIEIRNLISVNYYHRFSGLKNKIPEDDLLHWLSGLGKSLNINTIIIHGNYSSYAHIVENILSKSNLDQKTLLSDFKTIQNIDNPDANILNLYTADINTYCIDLVEYIFEGKKRFGSKSYVVRKVPLHIIDKLTSIKFDKLYETYGKSEHIFDDLYRTFKKLDDKNISTIDFYKIIHNLYPYVVPSLHNLIVLSLPKSSVLPWHFYYIFKPFEYLFEKELISFIPATDLDKIDTMIKNLADEVKFIHENKFRQI